MFTKFVVSREHDEMPPTTDSPGLSPTASHRGRTTRHGGGDKAEQGMKPTVAVRPSPANTATADALPDS